MIPRYKMSRRHQKAHPAVESPKTSVVHLVHGILTSDGGERTVLRLRPFFESSGLSVKVFSYGWIGPMGARFLNPRIAKQLIALVGEKDIGVGHSNGCTLLHRAARTGATFRGLVYINPALKADVQHARRVEWIDVYFNQGDYVVRFAELKRLIAPWAPLGDPQWGDMGARGAASSANRLEAYTTNDLISRLLNSKNATSARWPLWQFALQVIVGLPCASLYLLCLAPVEVLLTIFHNNICARSAEMRLRVRRPEDAKFIAIGFLFPVLLWAVAISWMISRRAHSS
jgi:hypothetical protein